MLKLMRYGKVKWKCDRHRGESSLFIKAYPSSKCPLKWGSATNNSLQDDSLRGEEEGEKMNVLLVIRNSYLFVFVQDFRAAYMRLTPIIFTATLWSRLG